MSKLDLVLARLRELPPERQEAMAEEISFRLEQEAPESAFNEQEWAAIESSMDESGEDLPHDAVVAEMTSRFPG